MSDAVSVLIPTRFVWDGICLTVESILKRTTYPHCHIIVADNSEALNALCCEPHAREALDGDNGSRIDYLRDMAESGSIQLIENSDQGRSYGHGENIKVLLDACKTRWAMLFVSSAEIVEGNWLDALVTLAKMGDALGIARYREGGVHFDTAYRAPLYWPNIMLLDMEKYREYAAPDDWDLRHVSLSAFHRPELFADCGKPEKGRADPLVFCDTGWRLTERLKYENPDNHRILPLPPGYYTQKMHLYGGIDRNSHRPHIPYVQERLEAIGRRLRALRAEA